MDKRITVGGDILGINFALDITEGSDESLTVTGTADGKPVDLIISVREGYFSAGGTLLGHPVRIGGHAPD